MNIRVVLIGLALLGASACPLIAQVKEWHTQNVIPGTESISVGPSIDLSNLRLGFADFRNADLSEANLSNSFLANAWFRKANLSGVNLSGANVENVNFDSAIGFTSQQLYDTATYRTRRLAGTTLANLNLTDWNLSRQDLRSSVFLGSNLAGVDFTNSLISDADFGNSVGLSAEQLYSTKSYQQQRLDGLGLWAIDLSGWSFQGQALVGVDFEESVLDGADFTNADLRDALTEDGQLDNVTLRNTIMPNGDLPGLEIGAGETFSVREGNVPIAVSESFVVGPGAQLVIELNDDTVWHSTLRMTDDVATSVRGKLEIRFEAETDFSVLVPNLAFDLFDWPDTLAPEDRFATIELPAGIRWDLSRLYDTGEVTILEPPGPLDFSLDGQVGSPDIDLLCDAINNGSVAAFFDLNDDGELDAADISAFLERTNRFPGDADLDGSVQFSDFVALANRFGETGTSWSGGDFDCDGTTQFPDFIILAEFFGRTSVAMPNAASAAASVPEPSAVGLACLALLLSLSPGVRYRTSGLPNRRGDTCRN